MGLTALTMICMAAAFLLTASEMTGWKRGAWIFKPVASILFLIVAVFLGAVAGGTYGLLIFIALFLCFIGDILLIPRNNEMLFKAGIGAFLAGHVVYIAAFSLEGLSLQGIQAGAFVTALIVVPYLWYMWPKITPDFKLPVGAYTAVIAAMIVTAFGADAGWSLPVAALMFAVSDMMVGRDRFVTSVPVNHLVITPLYYGAQLIFAWSIYLH